MAKSVEYTLLRRVHDGEVSRVGELYRWRSPAGHLRSHCHQPLEVLAGLGLLTETDPDPLTKTIRPVVLTDAGRARLEQLAPPDAEEVTGWHVAGGCGHLVPVRYDRWVASCPTCDTPAKDNPGHGQTSTTGQAPAQSPVEPPGLL